MSNLLSRRTFMQASGVAIGSGAIPLLPFTQSVASAQERASAPVDVTRRLARYLVNSNWTDIPQDVRTEAVRSVFNWVGCCLGGARHITTDRALAALAEFSGTPEGTVLGRRERLDILHAALLNGISSHVLDYDDTHLETIIHPAGPVASAILALGEKRNISGEEFMHAFVLGVETECRIGKAVYPSHYDRGFHITGTTGVFGAAAASGKLLGLSEQQMVWALGIAATQSAGLKEMFGTMCKPFHPGSAAQNGLKAALLAAKDFTSSDQGIEAPEGFAFTYSDVQDFSQVTDNLGSTFEVSRNTYKPFACGIVTHPIIDGCIQLRNENNLVPAQIARVALRVNPLVLSLTGKTTPQTGLESKFSIYHASAAAIIRGTAGPSEFTDATVQNGEVIALRGKVTAQIDENVSEEEAFVSITLNDGSVLDKHVEHAIGSMERPMTREALEQKFSGQAASALPVDQIERVMALCWDIESITDINELIRATVPV
ncbi:MAG: MmgE/PrpD family protein [Gammaproteobacteria bacterium]|mgnify:FL=1|nr:MmgE/PrpD family protein [Gammaproteobacteria bacterium]HJO10750.1 MmgE/PrpD family protein [Gammaproteobacteria bacterium]